jgi:hypothetical protein
MLPVAWAGSLALFEIKQMQHNVYNRYYTTLGYMFWISNLRLRQSHYIVKCTGKVPIGIYPPLLWFTYTYALWSRLCTSLFFEIEINGKFNWNFDRQLYRPCNSRRVLRIGSEAPSPPHQLTSIKNTLSSISLSLQAQSCTMYNVHWYRVPGFLSSRPNWLPPPSHLPACVAPPPPWFWEGDTLAGLWREQIWMKGQTLWYSRYTVYFNDNPSTSSGQA